MWVRNVEDLEDTISDPFRPRIPFQVPWLYNIIVMFQPGSSWFIMFHHFPLVSLNVFIIFHHSLHYFSGKSHVSSGTWHFMALHPAFIQWLKHLKHVFKVPIVQI
jgi:hypothetical protein